MVATKQLKVRLINKITGILASKFKRRRFVAMDSPQKGNDDFDRSLSLFSLSCATGEHDDDNRTIPKNNQTIMGNQSSRIAMIGKKISIKAPQQLFKLVYSQVVFGDMPKVETNMRAYKFQLLCAQFGFICDFTNYRTINFCRTDYPRLPNHVTHYNWSSKVLSIPNYVTHRSLDGWRMLSILS